MSDSPVICWFRRDLRLQDNAMIADAAARGTPIVPVFVFDPDILSSGRVSVPRLKFMLSALRSLNDELEHYGSSLVVRFGQTPQVLSEIASQTGATKLYFNMDYTPFARDRDDEIKANLEIEICAVGDRLLIEPGDLLKDDGDPYVVYTPFKKKWRNLEKPPLLDYDIASVRFFDTSQIHGAGEIPSLQELEFTETINTPDATSHLALHRLEQFLSDAVNRYADDRNQLDVPGNPGRTATSFLSPYIRFGLISTRQIYWACRDAYTQAREPARESINTFVDEIIWHEFYTHILWHFPHVKTQNFRAKYDGVEWRHAPDELDAWKHGQTGYPIVDAAMRQLRETGWMHNRARMIVASFLTKDLLIDWREGERHFMQWLIDGDLAANNGGWQWAAGTGTDAQPYFRIFNPVSQSRKFDPEGSYIRQWIPELRHVESNKHIHIPWEMPMQPTSYPPPIVDHADARKLALETYKAAIS